MKAPELKFDYESGLKVEVIQDTIDKDELAELMEQDSFDTNEYFRDRDERDQDLDEKRNGFRGVSRRNDAWDKKESDYC